ncbi:MAG: peptidylprolyl isomerase [Cyanobium sp.]
MTSLPADVVALLGRHELLRPLIERLVRADAVAGEICDPSLLQQDFEQFCRQRSIKSPEDLAVELSKLGISEKDLNWKLSLNQRIQRHCDLHYRHKAEARFLQRKNDLDLVVYSLIRVKDPMLARELYFRIAAGEATFAELASAYAEGPEKASHGIIGPTPLSKGHPALAERLRVSSPGALIEPFAVSDWNLVVRLEQYTPANFDDRIAAQMAAELFEEDVQAEVSRRLTAELARLNMELRT